MPLCVLFLDGKAVDSQTMDELLADLPEGMELFVTTVHQAVEDRLDEIEIVAGVLPTELLGRCPNLKWAQQWAAGADWLSEDERARNADFVLTNVSGLHAIPISEHIFAMILGHARRLNKARQAQRAGEWLEPDDNILEGSTPFLGGEPLTELAGKTMLLLGVGGVGRRTARLAQAFEMKIVGMRQHPESLPEVDVMIGVDELDDALSQADYLVLTLPLTPDTRGILNADRIGRLKASAYVVNIGRGELIDEKALIGALERDEIAGAGLDVFTHEPLPSDSPLWKLSNVTLTPHCSGLSPHYTDRALRIFLKNLKCFRDGETLEHVVDKQKGY